LIHRQGGQLLSTHISSSYLLPSLLLPLQVSMKHLGESVKAYAGEYTRLVPEEWRKTLNLPPPPPLPMPPYKKREEEVEEVVEVKEEEIQAMVGDEEGDWF